MRVIDDDERTLTAAKALHPTGWRCDVRQRAKRSVELDVAREQHAKNTQHVLHVEKTGDRYADLTLSLRCTNIDRHPGGDCGDARRDDIRPIGAVGNDVPPMAARLRNQRLPE